MNYKLNNEAPISYEHWIDSGRIIIPCLKGKPIITRYSSAFEALETTDLDCLFLDKQFLIHKQHV